MIDRLLATARLLPILFVLGSTALAAGFSEEVVAFTSHDGLTIRCILSYPDEGEGPFPGMLFIAGSGLHDANVTIRQPTLAVTRGTQRLFRPVARYFSRQGWAVQRCNKRGASFDHRNDRPEILAGSRLDDLVEDARNALAALHEHRLVAARPLVVYGHSEGTAVAVRLAQSIPEIDLLVLVGSVARPMESLLEYQLVDRNLEFLRRAADADGDGTLTLAELDTLDGNFGLGSIYVLNSAEVLFYLSRTVDGQLRVRGFNPNTDLNGDGRLAISAEIEPVLRRETARLLEMGGGGLLGRYWQSMLEAEAPLGYIHSVETPILFVHGALDVQSPVDEALLLMGRLEAESRSDYDILIFPGLGHSLSKPNDFYKGDGGLTALDNLTLNAPRLKTRRQLLRRIEANLDR